MCVCVHSPWLFKCVYEIIGKKIRRTKVVLQPFILLKSKILNGV